MLTFATGLQPDQQAFSFSVSKSSLWLADSRARSNSTFNLTLLNLTLTMSTRLPSISTRDFGKLLTTLLTAWLISSGAVSHASEVKYLPYEELSKETKAKISRLETCQDVRFSESVVVISGSCRTPHHFPAPLWVDTNTDANAFSQKVKKIPLNVGNREFDFYAVGAAPKKPEASKLYLSALFPTVYFDGRDFKDKFGSSYLNVKSSATVEGPQTNQYLSQVKFNRPQTAIYSSYGEVVNRGTIRAAEDMFEVPADKFGMFYLNNFYSVRLYRSWLQNWGEVQGTVYATSSWVSNKGIIYGSPKENGLIAVVANSANVTVDTFSLSRSSKSSVAELYGDVIFSSSLKSQRKPNRLLLVNGTRHVGNVYLRSAFQNLIIDSESRSNPVHLNGTVYASKYATISIVGYKRPTKKVQVPKIESKSLRTIYALYKGAETNESSYVQYYLSDLVPEKYMTMPGKSTQTENPTGTLVIGGTLSLNDLSLDTSKDAIFYGVQRVLAGRGGLIVHDLPVNSKSTIVTTQTETLPLYFAELDTCAIPGEVYDYERLKQMQVLKQSGKLEANRDCYGKFSPGYVPEHLKGILEQKSGS